MRESCIACTLKHLGKAAILMQETKNYPHHFVYIVGNLSEAEDECEEKYPELRDRIYELRKLYMKGESVDIDALVQHVFELYKLEE